MKRNCTPRASLVVLSLCGATHLSTATAQTTRTDSLHHLDTIVVRAHRAYGTTSGVESRVGREQLDRNMGMSLASLLSEVRGLSMIQTGTTIAKPVIQGMHSNRILIVNNGSRQSGQQWGDDHAPEVDAALSGTISVIKGAESVRYGSEALGGIILMEQKALPYHSTPLSGEVSTLYATNGRRSTSLARLEGSLPSISSLAYRVQGAYTNAGDRSTAHYLLNNTGMHELNFTAAMGYQGRDWSLEGFWSRYDSKGGILLSAQLGDENLLRERIALGRPQEIMPFSRDISYPYHHVVHNLYTLKAVYKPQGWGTFTWLSSLQQDDRREYSLRRAERSHLPSLALKLTSLQHNLRWQKSYQIFSTEIGAQYQQTECHSLPGTGVVALIPNYTEHSVGGYAVQRLSMRRLSAELGVRLEHQQLNALGYDAYGELYGGKHRYTQLSYNLGGRYQLLPELTLSSNFGLARRSPHVHELYSHGHEHGSATFIIGDSQLHDEHGYKWITSLAYHSDRVHAEVDGFLQWVRGYIYDAPTGEVHTTVSGTYPVFRFTQANAFFRGIDAELTYHISRELSYHITTSTVWAHDTDTGRYFPYIPSWRVGQQLSWTPRSGLILTLKHRFVDKQRRFDPDTDLIPYAPPAYALWGAEISQEWKLGTRQSLKLLLAGDNLLNKEYKEYTNRARYYAHDAGQDIRLSLHYHF